MAIKKVAIATWWHYHNYGSALQSTALYNALKGMGYDPDIINYIASGREYPTNPDADREHKEVWSRNARVVDNLREEAFNKYLNTQLTFTQKTQNEDDFDELNSKYDAFIAGSDQIWAPRVFDEHYFLNFVRNNSRKIAYAPSIGLPSIENGYVKSRMSELISQFAHISVREKQGADTIKNELGIDRVVTMPDPTLLLDYNEWRTIIPRRNADKEKKKFILCYFLGENENAWRHVQKIAKQSGYEIKIIPVLQKDEKHGDSIKGVGPEEFFNLVDEATIVLTDSFHGAIFSIITQTPFYVFERFKSESKGSQNSRVYNLLRLTGLDNRLIGYHTELKDNYVYKIGFADTLKIIEKEKLKAYTFLRSSVDSTKNISDTKDYEGMVDITKEFSVRSGVLSVIDSNIKTKLDRFGQYAYFVDEKYKASDDIQKKLDYVDSTYNLLENENKISDEIFKGVEKQQDLLGRYTGLYIGHVKDRLSRDNSTSGGFATYILTELLRRKMVDYVICPHESDSNDTTLYRYNVCSTINDVKKSAKTKYYPMELSEVLQYVKEHEGRYAVVGITGYVYEIRLLQKIELIFKERIKYTIGLITCHQKSAQYTEQIAWQHGIEPEDLQTFQYRVKNRSLRPDVYLAEFSGLKDGKKTTIQTAATENYGTDWAHGFFKTAFSDFTDDVFNKTADISLGDAWDERWIQDKGGNNVVVCRNNDIQGIIDEGIGLGKLEVFEVTEDEAITTQKGNIHHMVDDLPYRIEHYGNKSLRICNDDKYINKQIPTERQLVQKVRHEIYRRSFSGYHNARKHQDYKVFIKRTKDLIDKYQIIYTLIPSIHLLEDGTRSLRVENANLTSTLTSFLSIKRSARLLAGNIKRHYSRGFLGKIKRRFRLRTRARGLLHSARYSLNRLYWMLKDVLINHEVSKITQRRLGEGMKIPKVIHYIWVGGTKKPESVEKYIETWKKHCPDYEIIEWNEKNYNVSKNRYAREAYDAKKWAFVTDYIRLDVIERFGGIYMDSDVEVLKNLDEFLKKPAFSSFEAGNPDQIFLPTGMMASEKGGEWVKYLKSYYTPERSFFREDGQIDTTPNTVTITKMTVGKYGIKLNNRLQEYDDFTMYPSEYFCPKSWSTRKINTTKNSHTIHHFAASWLPPEVRELQHEREMKK